MARDNKYYNSYTLASGHFPYNNVNDSLSQIARHLKLVFFTRLTRTTL